MFSPYRMDIIYSEIIFLESSHYGLCIVTKYDNNQISNNDKVRSVKLVRSGSPRFGSPRSRNHYIPLCYSYSLRSGVSKER